MNGIRARAEQLAAFLKDAQPDIVCLQEIKAAPSQVPGLLFDPSEYWSKWHGAGGYSGVALLVKRSLSAAEPAWQHPKFDHECRMVTAVIGAFTVASVYVPNGGKDFDAKMTFLEQLRLYAGEMQAAGQPLVLCGDLNVARADMDVHPRERKPNAFGQMPVERYSFAKLLEAGLTDLQRAMHPDNAELFTWWAPWRNLRQRNIGWRIDYILATAGLASRARTCQVFRETGTSDHAPLMAEFEI